MRHDGGYGREKMIRLLQPGWLPYLKHILQDCTANGIEV